MNQINYLSEGFRHIKIPLSVLVPYVYPDSFLPTYLLNDASAKFYDMHTGIAGGGGDRLEW
jgi:hypothetical protein